MKKRAKRECERIASELLELGELGVLSDAKIAEISLLTLKEVEALNAQRTA